jgi:hypothetical protein
VCVGEIYKLHSSTRLAGGHSSLWPLGEILGTTGPGIVQLVDFARFAIMLNPITATASVIILLVLLVLLVLVLPPDGIR